MASAPPQEWPEDKSSSNFPPPPYELPQYSDPSQTGPGFPQLQGYGFPPPYSGVVGGEEPLPSAPQYPVHPGFFTVQPTVLVTHTPVQNPVNDHRCYAICTMIFCCLPIGVAALLYSNAASRYNCAGDLSAAKRSAKLALRLSHAALISGVVVYISFISLLLVFIFYLD